MKNDYLNSINKNIINQHVKLSLPNTNAVPQGPLVFISACIPSDLQVESFPLLVDSGATNSCLSLATLASLGYTEDQICTEIQYSLSNVTEHENHHTIIGSILLDIELSSQSKLSILSVQFLILESDLQYGILGGLELQNTQTILCLACKSMSSLLNNGKEIEWTKLRTYQSYDLKNEFPDSINCKHTLLSEKNKKEYKVYCEHAE